MPSRLLTPKHLPAVFLIVSTAIIAAPLPAQEPSTSLLNATRAIALNAKTGRVYAVGSAQGAVTVFDPTKKTTVSVKVGKEPVALAVNEITNRIYVANNGSGSISVIDGVSDAVVATINVGALPYVIAINPVTNKVFVSNTFSDFVTLIDGATNATSTVKAGSADSIVVDAQRDRAYLTGWEGTSLTVLDSKPSIARKIRMNGMHLWGVAVDESSGKIFATRAGSAQLAIVDSSDSVSGIPTGAIPCAVAVNPTTGMIYVVNYGEDSVTVVDSSASKVVATVKVGNKPQGIAIDSKANRIYVANVHDNSISAIDGVRNQVVGTFSVGKNPYALAVNQATGKVYVAFESDPAAVLDSTLVQ
jgi:YVTN family beta-propeller protein